MRLTERELYHDASNDSRWRTTSAMRAWTSLQTSALVADDYVTRLLDRAATFQGYPKEVRTDNGPEFTFGAFMTWAQKHGIKHILIEPSSPTQNAYIESFYGTFRD
jgi:transposase InsO family protein